jgi:Mg-chelatase subunit ChlD
MDAVPSACRRGRNMRGKAKTFCVVILSIILVLSVAQPGLAEAAGSLVSTTAAGQVSSEKKEQPDAERETQTTLPAVSTASGEMTTIEAAVEQTTVTQPAPPGIQAEAVTQTDIPVLPQAPAVQTSEASETSPEKGTAQPPAESEQVRTTRVADSPAAVSSTQAAEEITQSTPAERPETQTSLPDQTDQPVEVEAFSPAAAAGTRTYMLEGEYTVCVTYGEDAGIPENALLQVSEIRDDEQVRRYASQAADVLGDEVITAARFFDICFISDGREIEPDPAAKVDVQISFHEAMEVGDGETVQAVHFAQTPDSSVPEILPVDTQMTEDSAVQSLTFSQNSFSVTGVVVTAGELVDGWPADDGQYVVLLSYTKKDGSSDSTNTGMNYYALKNDGTLMQVSVNGGTAVFPSEIRAVDDIKHYVWTSNRSAGTFVNLSGSRSVYIDPYNSQGVSSAARKLSVVNRHIGTASAISSRYYYLAVTRDGTETVTTSVRSRRWSQDSPYAAEVTFLKSFALDDTKPGQGSGDELSLEAPNAIKTLTDNGNGTYDLSLAVQGQSRSSSESSRADVLIIQDTSGSMNDPVGQTTRMAIARQTLDTLGEKLLAQNSVQYPDRVRLSLITFASRASEASAWTTDKNIFKQYVGNETPNGGTNWEAALYSANQTAFREDAEKYVIFISDGQPTFYRGTETAGANQDVYMSYWFAKDDAYSIVQKGIHFYSISVFEPENVAGYMENLTRYAYSGTDSKTATYPEDRYYMAQDEEAIKKAFSDIIDEITHKIDYQNVTVYDGLTQLTSSRLISGSTENFRYSVTDADGNEVPLTPGDDNTFSYTVNGEKRTFRGAAFTDGNIVWSMDADEKTAFALDSGYTYKVTFTVWPDQAAFDLAAGLMNGTLTYDGLTEEQKAQISPGEGGNYRLKTNTPGTKVAYSSILTESVDGQITQTIVPQEPAQIDNPEGILLKVRNILVRKEWVDDLDSGKRPEVIYFNLIQDKGTEAETTLFQKVPLSADNDWSTQIHVAPGLISDGEVLENGHTYDIEEPEADSHYELKTRTWHPMLNGSQDGLYDYDGSELKEQITEFSASNMLKGSLMLEKKLQSADGEDITLLQDGSLNPALKDEIFIFQVNMTSPGKHSDQDYQLLFYGQDAYDTTEDPESGTFGEMAAGGVHAGDYSLAYDPEQGETTVQIRLKLKIHERIVAAYLPGNTRYSITETGTISPANGRWNVMMTVNGEDRGDKAEDTVLFDEEEIIGVTNRCQDDIQISLRKTDADGHLLTGAQFILNKIHEDGTPGEAVTMRGETLGALTDRIGDLPDGTYRLTETQAPAGYTRIQSLDFTVNRGNTESRSVVTAASDSETVKISSTDDGTAYTIIISDSRIYELPKAGGNGIYWYILCGTLISIIFACAAVYGNNRERRCG